MTAAFRELEEHAAGAAGAARFGRACPCRSCIYTYPLVERMIEASETLGLTHVPDLNSANGVRVGL